MNNLLAAVMTRIAGSALSSRVGGRIVYDEAPQGTEYPYVVFSIVTGTPEDTFLDYLDETIIQFSLYSISPGVAEIASMYADLKTLLDWSVMPITANYHIWTMRQNLTTMREDVTAPDGTAGIRHWAVDYSIMTEKK